MCQMNARLRSMVGNHFGHWCPGCGKMHGVPLGWEFDGNYDAPTVRPSVRITGKKTIKNERGEWTGSWERDADGGTVDFCCHYNLTAGQLQFCSDSTHALAGTTVPLPSLPEHLQDGQA